MHEKPSSKVISLWFRNTVCKCDVHLLHHGLAVNWFNPQGSYFGPSVRILMGFSHRARSSSARKVITRWRAVEEFGSSPLKLFVPPPFLWPSTEAVSFFALLGCKSQMCRDPEQGFSKHSWSSALFVGCLPRWLKYALYVLVWMCLIKAIQNVQNPYFDSFTIKIIPTLNLRYLTSSISNVL